MTGIYKIESPSGRIYIGQAVNICIRFISYRKMKCKMQPRLYGSFSKYGVENHKFNIVELCNINDLNNRERYWQDFYNVISKVGLNCILTKSDDMPKVISDETKQKIRSKTILYRHTEEAKSKISESLKGRIVSDQTRRKISESQIGKIVLKSTCNKISEALKGRKIPKEVLDKRSKSISGEKNHKSRLIIDTATGIYYGCISDAAEAKGIKRGTLNNYLIGHRPNKTSMIYA
jgi:group I intron endonuclease